MNLASGKLRIIIPAVALVIGLLAGAFIVYGTAPLSGNGAASTKTADIAQTSCKTTHAIQASLEAAAIGDLAAMRIASKPIALSDVGFEMPNGDRKSFADWQDKVVLLNIWATWCGPCREEMPELAALQTEYASKHFDVLALNVDRNGGNKPKEFLDSINANALGLYLDPTNSAFQELRARGLVFGLPTTMILDASGCVHGVLAGFANWDSQDAKNLLDAAIKELGKPIS